jgi:hypothetical protein
MASPNLPVTVSDLNELVTGLSATQAEIFIDSAHAIVDGKITSVGYAPRTVYLIELYLAAHFALQSTDSGGMISTKVGQSEERYSDPGSMLGIEKTRFGQQALSLDTLGILSDLAASNVKAIFKVYGSYDTTTNEVS